MSNFVICPYCQGRATLRERRVGSWAYSIWLCAPCNAYVGCHDGGVTPLGSLANEKLRNLRMKAHDRFDRCWSGGGYNGAPTRKQAYQQLAKEMNLPDDEVHIAKFRDKQCELLIGLLSDALGIQRFRAAALSPNSNAVAPKSDESGAGALLDAVKRKRMRLAAMAA